MDAVERKPGNNGRAGAAMLDSEILDRIGEVNGTVIRLETKFDAFISQNRCNDHAERLRDLELSKSVMMTRDDCERHHSKQSNFRWQTIGVIVSLLGVMAAFVTIGISVI